MSWLQHQMKRNREKMNVQIGNLLNAAVYNCIDGSIKHKSMKSLHETMFHSQDK